MKSLSRLLLVFMTTSAVIFSASGAEAKKKHILFFSKSATYEHSVIKKSGDELSHAEKILEQLAANNNWEFTFTKDGGVFTPGNLEKFDAFFFYTTGDLTERGKDNHPPMSPAGKRAFLQAIERGKGFIGSHSASDTFHSPGNAEITAARFKNDDLLDPYVKMLGGEFIKHGQQQKARQIVADKSFPGMSSVPADFGPHEEWYSLKNFAPDLHVLLVQDTSTMKNREYERPPFPSTWARMHGKGRVFYTSMGHREDVWTNPIFQKVLEGGINWAIGNVDADITPNIDKVTPKAKILPPAK